MGAFVSLPPDPNDPLQQLRRLSAVPAQSPALPNLLPFVKPGLAAKPNSPLSALPAAQGIGGGFNLLPAQTSNGPMPGPRLQALPSQAPPELSKVPNLGGNGPLPDLGTAPAPNVGLPASAPASRLGADQTELTRLQQTGAGVDQIKSPWLRGFAKVGDVALQSIAPAIATAVPGTELHNRYLQSRAQGRVAEDQAELKSGGDLAQQQAQTGLLNTENYLKPTQVQNTAALNTAKIDHYSAEDQHYQDQTDTQLAAHGYKRDQQGNVAPMTYSELSPQLQAIEDLKGAQTEQAEAQAALSKAKNDPHSPAYRIAAGRLAVAQQNANTAVGRLSLYGRSLDLRQQNMDAQNYGTDPKGNPLPGALQIGDGQGGSETVGSRFAGGATKANSNAARFDDVHGALDGVESAAQKLVAKGGALNSPGVVAALTHAQTPHGWVTGAVSNYLQGANASSLSPEEREYVQAINAAHENVQALRASVGGGVSDSQINRLEAMVPGATTPDVNYLLGQTKQIRATADRLGQGVGTAAGGLRVRGQARPPSQNTPQGSAPAGDVPIPAEAAAQLKEGTLHTFGNGQAWTLRNGQPVRIK